MFIGHKTDLLNNLKRDLKQGESIFNFLTKKLSVYVGNDFIDLPQVISASNGNLDDFDRIHLSGIYNVNLDTKNNPRLGQNVESGFAFFIKRNIYDTDEYDESIKASYNELQVFVTTDLLVLFRVVIGQKDGSLSKGLWKEIYNQTPNIVSLDTPYHATQMSKLGILDSYHNYLTELHEYEKSQNVQSDSEIMALNILQPPVIPTEVEAYAKEYNLI